MEMLKLKIPSSNTSLTKEVLIEYMNFLMENYPKINADVDVGPQIPKSSIKKSMADDMAAEALGIEEEDLLRYLKSKGPAIMQEADLFGLVQQFQGMVQAEAMQEM